LSPEHSKPPSGAGSGIKEKESKAMHARFGKVFRQVILGARKRRPGALPIAVD